MQLHNSEGYQFQFHKVRLRVQWKQSAHSVKLISIP